MKILFILTFAALLVVSWTHPVIREELRPYENIIEHIVETQRFDMGEGKTIVILPPATVTPAKNEKQDIPKETPAKTAPKAVTPEQIPPPQPTSSSSLQQSLEQAVHARINGVRQEFGLSTLSWNEELADVARGHSSDMLAKDYFSHEDANGCDMVCRTEKANVTWQAIGENIYMMSGYKLDALELSELIVSGWMDSEGHRANILRDSFTTQGIGVAIQGKSVYTTELLTKPRQ